jgi:hypothetical protein
MNPLTQVLVSLGFNLPKTFHSYTEMEMKLNLMSLGPIRRNSDFVAFDVQIEAESFVDYRILHLF